MGIELYWDNDERTVMLCEVREPWTWDELFKMLDTIKKVTDNADHEIAAILDVSDGVSIPGGSIFNPATFENAKKILKMGEGGTGPVVIVGTSPLIKTIYRVALTLDRKSLEHLKFVATVDEARALLAQESPLPA